MLAFVTNLQQINVVLAALRGLIITFLITGLDPYSLASWSRKLNNSAYVIKYEKNFIEN